MSVLANVKVKEMERVLFKKGFLAQNAKGSGNIPKPIVSKILKQAGISLEEFKSLRK